MSTWASVLVLVGVLVFAVVRPWGLPEAVAAVPAAGVVVVSGLVSWHGAVRELATLGPTVGFLAAVLVLAHLADQAGVFRYAGSVAGRLSRGSPRRLLGVVFVIASAVTAVLSLDATVVLLTPVVLVTATTARMRARPHLYACTHLANSASLLLPVSNLTNLLAFTTSGLTFARFAGLMALPWLAVIDGQFVLLHVIDPADLEAVAGARAGLLGRAVPATATPVREALEAGQAALFDAAEARLGRPAERSGRRGRVEREVVAACADAGLLVLTRDGDHTRLGPRSLGHTTRFVLDHAPCRVLLVWPDEPPDLATMPPPPPGSRGPHRTPPPPPGPPRP